MSVCVCVCVCVCVRARKRMRMWTCVRVCVRASKRPRLCTCVHASPTSYMTSPFILTNLTLYSSHSLCGSCQHLILVDIFSRNTQGLIEITKTNVYQKLYQTGNGTNDFVTKVVLQISFEVGDRCRSRVPKQKSTTFHCQPVLASQTPVYTNALLA